MLTGHEVHLSGKPVTQVYVRQIVKALPVLCSARSAGQHCRDMALLPSARLPHHCGQSVSFQNAEGWLYFCKHVHVLWVNHFPSSVGWPTERAQHNGAGSSQPQPRPRQHQGRRKHSESRWQPEVVQAPVQQDGLFMLAQHGYADTHGPAIFLPAASASQHVTKIVALKLEALKRPPGNCRCSTDA